MKLKTPVWFCLLALVACLTPAAHAQTFGVLDAFTGEGEGTQPFSGVTLRGGALFGVT